MSKENCSNNTKVRFEPSQIKTSDRNDSNPSFDIEVELDNLKETILSSSRVPFTELAIVDEDLLLDRILYIQENLPLELATAIEIVNRRQEIIADAQGYACLIVKSAEEKAERMLQESAIVRQAELDGAKIRLKTEQECEQLRQNALAECEAMQMDTENYVDAVLEDLENRLRETISIVHNGRQGLNR